MAEREDFKITAEEANKLRKAMKDEEFRKLLTEYAHEISNPENRARYEKELTELERQRGVNLQFIRPTPGFVMKVLTAEGNKVFINVCQSKSVNEAVATPVEEKSGDQWMIPYSLAPPRDDLDKAGKRCVVIDAVFHPETYKKGQGNSRFKNLLVLTVLDGIENNLKIKLDRSTLVFLRMPYKGMPTSTVIREWIKEPDADSREEEGERDFGPLTVPYPPLKKEMEAKSRKAQEEKKQKEKPQNEPEYTIVHRGEMSMQDFTNERSSSRIKRPKELVVTVHLPGVKSAKTVELDIFEKSLQLHCPKPLYKLDLALPYPINEDNGSAKFNKSKKSLVITLPVLPLPHPPPLAPTAKPLVSEILPTDVNSKPTNGTTETESCDVKEDTLTHGTEDAEQEVNVGVVQEVTKEWTSKGAWQCPPFSYRQDDSTVFFVLYTSEAKKSSMVSHFDDHQAQLTYSTASGQNYSFSVTFPAGCSLDCDDCSVDVSQDNVVLILVKSDESSDKQWDDFEVGYKSAQTTEKKLFLTPDNVKSAVEQVNSSDEPWGERKGWSESAKLEVMSLSDDHMEVKVTDNAIETKKPDSQASFSGIGKSTGAGGDKGEKEKGSLVPGTGGDKKLSTSPTAARQTDDKTKENVIELKSEHEGDSDSRKVESIEQERDLKPKVPEEKKERDSVASCGAEVTTQESTVAMDGDKDSKPAEEVVAGKDSDTQRINKEPTFRAESSGKERLGRQAVETDSSKVVVESDGSVFVKADSDYTETKPLEQAAKAQNEQRGSKIQFSNQLAFDLD